MRTRNIVISAILVIAALVSVWQGLERNGSPSSVTDPQVVEKEADNQAEETLTLEEKAVQAGFNKGESPPSFSLDTLDGKRVEMEKGKPVLINFWATWCGPCRNEMPYIQEAYEKYKDEMQFMMVNWTSEEFKKNAVPDYMKAEGYTFPVLMDETGEAADLYQVMATPTTYLLDKDGVIQVKTVGEYDREQLFRDLDKVLQKK
ncbi:TlpA disulfide reductase family protein [Mechercharimyces sp. CAU 1602]|uniref:TlpA family protein disulfide reductase n=1 Tax=Mechercharimyces sp. CAU 1602 TaxID=2973933 RepID=UPI002161AF6B|nr:TlpA disulfide reductase family protein [Mechercharimyces sp. CAU 1602]MCS1350597.1 TlpA family protein disulfide reductase [Mechercharimyces sp. CAU 1602]